MKLLHKGTVKDHKLIFDNPESFTVAKTLLEGKRFQLTLEKQEVVRSPNQNSYLHLVFKIIADYTGHTEEEVKFYYKQKFASKVDSHGIAFLQHTSKMTTVECSEFTEKVVADAAVEFGLNIPTPEEYASRIEEL